jgi:hypothetical protein
MKSLHIFSSILPRLPNGSLASKIRPRSHLDWPPLTLPPIAKDEKGRVGNGASGRVHGSFLRDTPVKGSSNAGF